MRRPSIVPQEVLIHAQVELDLSSEDLSSAFGVLPKTITSWLKGWNKGALPNKKNHWKIAHLKRLCDEICTRYSLMHERMQWLNEKESSLIGLTPHEILRTGEFELVELLLNKQIKEKS